MDVKLNRLNTFRHWPSSEKANASKLVAAGFYYTGRADVVKCFSCKETLGNWDAEDSPYAVHYILNPDCPFILGRETSRSPEIVPSAWVQNMQLSFSHKWNFSNDSLLYQIKNSDRSKKFPYPDSRFHFESQRLESFQNLENQQEFEKFAAAGFYYNSENCSLVCAFCKSEIPLSDSDCCSACVLHRNRFPDCPFICGIDVGNVSVGSEERIREKIAAHRQNLSQVVRRLNFNTINSLSSDFPEYTEEADRVQSFKMWPKYFASDLPQALAEAGFFYLGYGDGVKCFCCQLTLFDWKTGDIPLMKHWDKKPDCPYVVMIRENDLAVIDNVVPNNYWDAEILSQTSETSDIGSCMTESSSKSHPSEAASSDHQDSGCEQSDFELDLSPGSEFGWRFKGYLDPDIIRFAQKKGYTQEQIQNGGFFPDGKALAITIEKNLKWKRRSDELRSDVEKLVTNRGKEMEHWRQQVREAVRNTDQQWRQKDQLKDQQWRQKDQQWRHELRKATQTNNQLTQKVEKVVENNNQLTQKVEQVVENNNQLTQNNNQLTQKVEQVVENNNQLTQNNNQLTQKVEQVVENNNQLTQNNNQLTDEVSQLKAKLAVMMKENQQLRCS